MWVKVAMFVKGLYVSEKQFNFTAYLEISFLFVLVLACCEGHYYDVITYGNFCKTSIGALLSEFID